MSENRKAAHAPALGRWLLVGALLLIGLALYFVYAPSSEAPSPPVHEDR